MGNKKGMTAGRLIALILMIVILIIMGFGPFMSTILQTVGSISEVITGYNPFPPEKEEILTLPEGNYSAVVEFEDNSRKPNAIYRFDNGKWMWKCPECGSRYVNYMHILEDKDVEEVFEEGQVRDLTLGLKGKNEVEGAFFIQQLFNFHLDINKNAQLVITYTNNCQFTTIAGRKISSPSLYEMIKDPNVPISFSPGLKQLGTYSGEKCPK